MYLKFSWTTWLLLKPISCLFLVNVHEQHNLKIQTEQYTRIYIQNLKICCKRSNTRKNNCILMTGWKGVNHHECFNSEL
jgi:hypothetical protein